MITEYYFREFQICKKCLEYYAPKAEGKILTRKWKEEEIQNARNLELINKLVADFE